MKDTYFPFQALYIVSFLIALARYDFHYNIDRSGNSGIPDFAPKLRSVSYFTIKYDLNRSFFINAFYQIEEFLFYRFYYEWCWI